MLANPSLRTSLLAASSGALLALAMLAGCGGATPPAVAPPVPSPVPPTATPPFASKAAVPPETTTVAISDEIRQRCGIRERDTYFAFDSADVTTRDRGPLDGVAHCFVSGALKGRHLRLVGHSDPRGDSEYNVTLGLSRADAVERYLLGHGMMASLASTTSRGAMDAVGTDEAGWQKDRRVDVTLGD
jgi:peptidoglycan-associated lipoprotein